jgi:hypothetical protein
MADFPDALSKLPRTVLPSMATTSPLVTWAMDATQLVKQRPKASGSSILKSRPNVSWDGMPLGSSKNVRNHFSLAFPNCSSSTQSSTPQMKPLRAIMNMSINRCRLVRSTLGSFKLAKCFNIDASVGAFIPSLRHNSSKVAGN